MKHPVNIKTFFILTISIFLITGCGDETPSGTEVVDLQLTQTRATGV